MAKKIDKLFEVFCGEIITVLVDQEVEQSRQTEEALETLKSPLNMQGYLVDMDDEYLYLGYQPDVPAQAIKKQYVVHIEISDEEEHIMASNTNTKEYN